MVPFNLVVAVRWKTSGNLCSMYQTNAIKTYFNVCCCVSFILKGCFCISDTSANLLCNYRFVPSLSLKRGRVVTSLHPLKGYSDSQILGDIIKISIELV